MEDLPHFQQLCFLRFDCLGGLGIRIGIMHLLIAYVGHGVRPWYILASFIGIAAATVFNFLRQQICGL